LEQHAEREGCVLGLLERLILGGLGAVCLQGKQADHDLDRALLDGLCHCFRMLP